MDEKRFIKRGIRSPTEEFDKECDMFLKVAVGAKRFCDLRRGMFLCKTQYRRRPTCVSSRAVQGLLLFCGGGQIGTWKHPSPVVVARKIAKWPLQPFQKEASRARSSECGALRRPQTHVQTTESEEDQLRGPRVFIAEGGVS